MICLANKTPNKYCTVDKDSNKFQDFREKFTKMNSGFKSSIKSDLKVSLFRFKMMIKDSYMHKFMFGSFGFGAFFLISLYRKVNGIEENPVFLRFFFAGFLSSVIMLVFREIYIFWFKSIDIPGAPPKVSVGSVMKEMYREFAPDSFKKFVEKIEGVCDKVGDKYNKSVLGKFVGKTDMNYTCWLFLFLLILL